MARARAGRIANPSEPEEELIRALTAVSLGTARVENYSRQYGRNEEISERFEIRYVPLATDKSREQFAERAMLFWADQVNELRAAKNQPPMPATPEPKKTRRKR